MENDSILTELAGDSPLQLLKSLCEAQGKTTLALKQLEETQKELIAWLGNLNPKNQMIQIALG